MELLILSIFALMLVACVVMDLSVLYALSAGFILFFIFSLYKGNSLSETGRTCLSGIWTIKTILIAFILIGMLTASWRAAGTIPAIISYAAGLINPSIMILLTFLLNCLVSFMTGTSFGTSATMGVICYSVATSMGISPMFAGGAMLSGAFFGDRCSPVSTSALLVAEVTKTNIYTNIGYMFRTSLPPFIVACLFYLGLGFLPRTSSEAVMDAGSLFEKEFFLGLIPLLPAVLILLLSLLRVEVKKTMAASILVALLVYVFYQQGAVSAIPPLLVRGYFASDPGLKDIINGGGILSMIKAILIVSISASYSGLFKLTRLLAPLEKLVIQAGKKVSVFAVAMPITTFICMIACNQTLAVMLGNELIMPLEKDRQKRAIHLENSAILIAALIPWSIASAVPLASCGAPVISIAFACYLYLVPLWSLCRSDHWDFLKED